MITLGSLALEINTSLGNRQDVLTYTTFPTVANMQDTDRLAIWLKEAYTEIALGYRFEELGQEVDGQMTAGIDVYPLPALCRFLRAVTLLFPSVSGNQPRPIRRRHIRNVRRYQASQQGPPRIYAPFNPGGQPSIIVRPVPDQGYQFIWDVQVKPTFAATVAATNMFLPDDWIGVLKSLTKLKGHTGLVEPDKAQAEQTYLFGGYDPTLGRRVPGIIKQLTSARDQLDIEDTEFGLQPQIRRYTNSI
jgi:hypothetical protein